jgi:hypothetical protein
LKNSRAVTDRFHVAKKFNEVVDTLRKKLALRTFLWVKSVYFWPLCGPDCPENQAFSGPLTG